MAYWYRVKKKGYGEKWFRNIERANDYANKIGAIVDWVIKKPSRELRKQRREMKVGINE